LILWALKIFLFEWVLKSENQEQEMLLGVFNDVCESVIIKSLNLRKVGGAEIDELSVLEGFDESVGGAEIDELSVLDAVDLENFDVVGIDELVQVALDVFRSLDLRKVGGAEINELSVLEASNLARAGVVGIVGLAQVALSDPRCLGRESVSEVEAVVVEIDSLSVHIGLDENLLAAEIDRLSALEGFGEGVGVAGIDELRVLEADDLGSSGVVEIEELSAREVLDERVGELVIDELVQETLVVPEGRDNERVVNELSVFEDPNKIVGVADELLVELDESFGAVGIGELSVLGGLDGSVDEGGIDGFSVLKGLDEVVVDDLVYGDLDFVAKGIRVHERQRLRVHQRVQIGAGEGIEEHFGSITAAMSIALQR
jgi:hypothetical protein